MCKWPDKIAQYHIVDRYTLRTLLMLMTAEYGPPLKNNPLPTGIDH